MYVHANISSEATTVSSPVPAIFSDKVGGSSSPPSSPPGFPWERRATNEQKREHGFESDLPSPPSTKSAFSILGKRERLGEITANVQPNKKVSKNLSNTSKPLTQLQISLGQRVQVRCKTCGMEYVSSSAEDRVLHAKFHKQNNEGYTISKDFVRKSLPSKLLKSSEFQGAICAIDCHDKCHRIRHAQSVLAIVERELGAAPLSENAVWLTGTTVKEDLEPPYCGYMYICDSKCVGFLLVQRINAAFAVLEPQSLVRPQSMAKLKHYKSALAALKARQQQTVEEDQNTPIQISHSPSRARMGVARIWTAPAYRQRNVATRLLDAAAAHYFRAPPQMQADPRSNEISHMGISRPCDAQLAVQSKTLVAFSQPTEAGTRLARKWFGKRYGWLVYVD